MTGAMVPMVQSPAALGQTAACMSRMHLCMGSELVKHSGAPERAFQTVPIQAQSTAVAGATASICNDEWCRLGRTSGCAGMFHKLSDRMHFGGTLRGWCRLSWGCPR